MHIDCRSLEYVNYMVNCLGFFSGKNLNEMKFKKRSIACYRKPEMNPLPEIRSITRAV